MYQNGGLINSLTVLDNLKIPLMAHTRLKDDVIEVKETYECGVKLAKYDDIKVGDVIESFEMEKTAVKFVEK